VLATLIGLWLPRAADSDSDPFTGLDITRPQQRLEAPDFALEDLGGRRVRVRKLEGTLVLVHFWATWCAPCREEMPALQKLWERFRARGLVVLAIAEDRGNRRGVAVAAESFGISYPVLLDPDGAVRSDYEVDGLPTSYLIARDGKFVGRAIGPREWASDEAFELMEHLLEAKP
jgi:peroxiredoxin